MLNYFDIKPVFAAVKNPQSNAPVEWVHQVIYNMLVTKDIDNNVFDYINPWGEILSYISLVIRYYYHNTIRATPVQYVFGRDMIFNTTSVV